MLPEGSVNHAMPGLNARARHGVTRAKPYLSDPAGAGTIGRAGLVGPEPRWGDLDH